MDLYLDIPSLFLGLCIGASLAVLLIAARMDRT